MCDAYRRGISVVTVSKPWGNCTTAEGRGGVLEQRAYEQYPLHTCIQFSPDAPARRELPSPALRAFDKSPVFDACVFPLPACTRKCPHAPSRQSSR